MRQSRRMIRVGLVAAVAMCGLLTMVVAQDEKGDEAPEAESLYDQLGGAYPIAAVVDDFVERLFVNDVLNANPTLKEARKNPGFRFSRTWEAGLKYQITSFVCQATGGPENYTGRSMKESHKHSNISEREWQAMAADFKKSLDKFKVPTKTQAELFRIIGTTKSDIVTSK